MSVRQAPGKTATLMLGSGLQQGRRRQTRAWAGMYSRGTTNTGTTSHLLHAHAEELDDARVLERAHHLA